VFETTADIGFSSGSELSIVMVQALGNYHNIGKFRISLTTDDRTAFADGLPTGGDVTANWSVITPVAISAASGASFLQESDGSILVYGISRPDDVYTLSARTALTGITGIRLEVLTDSSLPGNGPGRASNGNFVLSEFTASISPVPEPSTFAFMALGLAGLSGLASYRRRAPRS
jgi:hypothetical protein